MRLSNDILVRQIGMADPTVLYMSYFLGLYAFGLTGILYGPLLVCMGTIFYETSKEMKR